MGKKKIVKITEGDIIDIVNRSVRRMLKESILDGGQEDSRWDSLVEFILPQIREKLENIDFSEGREWDEDNSFGVDEELEFQEDELDLGEYSDILDGITVRCEATGGARETYHRSADYYDPEESSGEGEVDVRIVEIDLYLTDGTEEFLEKDIFVGTFDCGW